ncbi:MAG: hypothetical protein HYU88_14415 [Chloroflexi bacterium]|nr:hypothetical protein [Chloroflexota bacterium]
MDDLGHAGAVRLAAGRDAFGAERAHLDLALRRQGRAETCAVALEAEVVDSDELPLAAVAAPVPRRRPGQRDRRLKAGHRRADSAAERQGQHQERERAEQQGQAGRAQMTSHRRHLPSGVGGRQTARPLARFAV